MNIHDDIEVQGRLLERNEAWHGTILALETAAFKKDFSIVYQISDYSLIIKLPSSKVKLPFTQAFLLQYSFDFSQFPNNMYGQLL